MMGQSPASSEAGTRESWEAWFGMRVVVEHNDGREVCSVVTDVREIASSSSFSARVYVDLT